MKALLFASLLCATAVCAEPPGPVAYVWQITCAGTPMAFGPFSTPDLCRRYHADVGAICERPLLGPNQPNPEFVAIADVCKIALNGRACVCEYREVRAKPFRSVLDMWREAEAARAAKGGAIKVGP